MLKWSWSPVRLLTCSLTAVVKNEGTSTSKGATCFPQEQLSQDWHEVNKMYVELGRQADLTKPNARALK